MDLSPQLLLQQSFPCFSVWKTPSKAGSGGVGWWADVDVRSVEGLDGAEG